MAPQLILPRDAAELRRACAADCGKGRRESRIWSSSPPVQEGCVRRPDMTRRLRAEHVGEDFEQCSPPDPAASRRNHSQGPGASRRECRLCQANRTCCCLRLSAAFAWRAMPMCCCHVATATMQTAWTGGSKLVRSAPLAEELTGTL